MNDLPQGVMLLHPNENNGLDLMTPIVIEKECKINGVPSKCNLIVNYCNLDIGLRCRIPVKVRKNGRIAHQPTLNSPIKTRLSRVIINRQNINIPDKNIVFNLDGNPLNCLIGNLKVVTKSEANNIMFENERKRNGIGWTFNKDRPEEPYSILCDPFESDNNEDMYFNGEPEFEYGLEPDTMIYVYKTSEKILRIFGKPVRMIVDLQDIGYALRATIRIGDFESDRGLPVRPYVMIPELGTTRAYAIGYAIKGEIPTEGMEMDHINRDTMDNRRCNLRLISREKNIENRMDQGGQLGIAGLQQYPGYYQVRYTNNKIPFSKSFSINKFPGSTRYEQERNCLAAVLKCIHEYRSDQGLPRLVPHHYDLIDKFNLREFI